MISNFSTARNIIFELFILWSLVGSFSSQKFCAGFAHNAQKG